MQFRNKMLTFYKHLVKGNAIYESVYWSAVVMFQALVQACNYYANIMAIANDLCHDFFWSRRRLLNTV